MSVAYFEYSADATAALADANVYDTFVLGTGDPGFTVVSIDVCVLTQPYTGSGSNYMSVLVKKGTTEVGRVDLAANQAKDTAVHADVVASTTAPTGVGAASTVGAASSVSPTFKAGDTFTVVNAETGTAASTSGATLKIRVGYTTA